MGRPIRSLTWLPSLVQLHTKAWWQLAPIGTIRPSWKQNRANRKQRSHWSSISLIVHIYLCFPGKRIWAHAEEVPQAQGSPLGLLIRPKKKPEFTPTTRPRWKLHKPTCGIQKKTSSKVIGSLSFIFQLLYLFEWLLFVDHLIKPTTQYLTK